MSEIYRDLGETYFGQELEANVRFARFKPDFVTNEQWCTMLGDDVNNYRHMEFTAGITAWYIYTAEELGHPFTEEEKDTLMLTAWTHDFAEAIDGDIPDPNKDHSEVAQSLERLSQFVVMQYVGAEDTVDVVMDVTQGKHPLSEHFRAIEHIGYGITGERAGAVMLDIQNWMDWFGYSEDEGDYLFHRLAWLNDEVTTHAYEDLRKDFIHLPVVLDYIGE